MRRPAALQTPYAQQDINSTRKDVLVLVTAVQPLLVMGTGEGDLTIVGGTSLQNLLSKNGCPFRRSCTQTMSFFRVILHCKDFAL